MELCADLVLFIVRLAILTTLWNASAVDKEWCSAMEGVHLVLLTAWIAVDQFVLNAH